MRRSCGQGGDDLRGDARGVDEDPVREARVDLDAGHGDRRLQRRERLVLDLAERRAVHRVGAARAERRDVEQRRALADLLVGREADADRRPRQLGMGVQVGDRGHDLRDAGLVVGAQQRVARRGDDVVARARGEVRLGGRIEHGARARQRDDAAVVGAVHERLDAGARRVGARVDVGDEADDRVADRRRRSPAASRSRSRWRRPRRRRGRSRRSSPASSAASSSWPGVLGHCVRSRLAWVSMRT